MQEGNDTSLRGATQTDSVKNGKKQEVQTNIKPIPNPTKEFSTSTYSVSIYMMDPDSYNRMIATGRKTVQGLPLLIQSGGINNGDTKANFGATRSQYFENDFYLDDIQFKSMISGTAVNAPHNSFELNFTVTEPMGLTFFDRLDKAIKQFNGGDPNFNFITQRFLMVIRFYGYTDEGLPATLAEIQKASSRDQKSDEQSFSEKWIPFMFKNIGFRLGAEQVVYSCEAVPAITFHANDKIHGTIPFNIGLQGQKIEDLLNGSGRKATDLTTQNAEKAPNGVALSGLAKLLNDWQDQLASCGQQEHADRYIFKIDPAIGNATIIDPKSTTLLNRTGMLNGQDNATIIKNVTGFSQVIKGVNTMAINAGQKIMTFLDLAIRTSTYISDQYEIVPDKNDRGTTIKVVQKKNNEPLKWFKIRSSVKILDNKFDCVRKMYASEITYTIVPYIVNTVDSAVYSGTECIVPHKEYDYWFTGRNTEVLNFAQNFNALYYATFGARSGPNTKESKNPNGQHNLRTMAGYKVNSSQSNQHGTEGASAEQGANIAATLYSPADQANIALDIVGDPDWIAQSELFYTDESDRSLARRTLPDRSVNYDHAEVFFALTFNTVVDYDIETGLADVTQKNFQVDPSAQPGGVAQYSFLYRANIIVTQLAQGKFTQQLQGTLQAIPEDCLTGKKTQKEKERVEQEHLSIQEEKPMEIKAPTTKSKTAGKKPENEKCSRANIKKLCRGKANVTSANGQSEQTATDATRNNTGGQ